MKQIIKIFLILMINSAQAQIFKCESKIGQIIYQDKECKSSNNQQELNIRDFDSQKILTAQKKLSKELQQRKALAASRAEQLLQQRQIDALSAQASSNRELAEATRENAYATQQQTEAVKYRRSGSNFYYNYPKYRNTKPKDKIYDRKPVAARYDNKNSDNHFNPPLRQPRNRRHKEKKEKNEDKRY